MLSTNSKPPSNSFLYRALSCTPAPETWTSITTDSLSICAASLLLSSLDYAQNRSHTWMMTGMAIRLAVRLELEKREAEHT